MSKLEKKKNRLEEIVQELVEATGTAEGERARVAAAIIDGAEVEAENDGLNKLLSNVKTLKVARERLRSEIEDLETKERARARARRVKAAKESLKMAQAEVDSMKGNISALKESHEKIRELVGQHGSLLKYTYHSGPKYSPSNLVRIIGLAGVRMNG